MNLQEMRECKRALGYSNETLAEMSGVPLATVQKVLSGITRSPRQKTVEALSRVLEAGKTQWSDSEKNEFAMTGKNGNEDFESQTPSSGKIESQMPGNEEFGRKTPGSGKIESQMPGKENPDYVRTGYAYPEVFTGIRNVVREQAGPNTIEDIYALPDGIRAELIDGKLYYIPTPTRTHQKIAGEMYLAAAAHLKAYSKECEVYIAPFGVYLNGDDSLYVEPDLSIIRDTSRLSERGCMGAPDWIIEVVSAPTRKTDYAVKLNKYRESGVKEYWIVDPSLRTVLTYLFDSDKNVEDADLFSFDAEIPSSLFKGLVIRPSDLF
ncbi:MAG: Uma2 family endonuclease [Lachnospiraceae bacterium]|nr:Uma2 family endonuclease [Lachnospiraceae bacterium]